MAEVAATGTEAGERFQQNGQVAVLIDWVLPDRPGIEVCREIRSRNSLIPIIFVSGRDDEASITRGLDAGADDFVVKPVRRTELVARLEAHLRKAAAAAASPSPPADARAERSSRFGDVEIDVVARTVRVGGREVTLGHLEFELLSYLTENPGIALSREQIILHVYGQGTEMSTERVDLLVRRLRVKLGKGSRRGSLLVAIPGFGYRLERRSATR